MLRRSRVPLALLLPVAATAFALGPAAATPGPPTTPTTPAIPVPPARPVAAGGISFPFGFVVGDSAHPTTSRVAKLGSELAFPPGRFDGALLGLNGTVPITGKLAVPAASSYFVTFRFMPATATVALIPSGDATGAVTVHTGRNGDCAAVGTDICADTDVVNSVSVKLSDARVDGRALDVGPDCRTAEPARVEIKGLLPLAFPAQPRKVSTTFTLPAFTGCTGHEDFSRLFSGLVSGPGNTLVTDLVLRCVGNGAPPNGCGAP
ncbi:hypothetical protein [Amycolatopsis sp. PS_44_ISF1]|uniref:hypothetical protein n=1 Tax=Amycolatopsis sp. PS_44_ISF1 TaxID=2974917 RepID=UPI0028DF8CD5|nr:hypothetical protein [Amycolatopsis sp. PS_44_ISF1]MDT8912977.1 hypothetical protein [Amycolatopsis sp. PS_44_ISF1]